MNLTVFMGMQNSPSLASVALFAILLPPVPLTGRNPPPTYWPQLCHLLRRTTAARGFRWWHATVLWLAPVPPSMRSSNASKTSSHPRSTAPLVCLCLWFLAQAGWWSLPQPFLLYAPEPSLQVAPFPYPLLPLSAKMQTFYWHPKWLWVTLCFHSHLSHWLKAPGTESNCS